jgi:hypothetical protein
MGQVPMNMGMIEYVWLKSGGATVQLQATKLTSNHFVKNVYLQMNESLATQLLLAATAAMIQNEMDDNEIVLNLHEKGMYENIRDLCTHCNSVVDSCNGQDRAHIWLMQLSNRHNFCRL